MNIRNYIDIYIMCLRCELHGSDDIIISELEETIDNPRYDCWNMTSIMHIVYISTGINGPQARELAIKILDGFIVWAKNNGKEFNSMSIQNKCGISNYPQINFLEGLLAQITQLNMTKEEVRDSMHEAIANG